VPKWVGRRPRRAGSRHRCICTGHAARIRHVQVGELRERGDPKGAAIIVIPGEVKSNNATFSQRYVRITSLTTAELELSRRTQVLDRANLGSVLREVELAYNLGDRRRAQTLFQKGALPNTRLIIKFDVPRRESR